MTMSPTSIGWNDPGSSREIPEISTGPTSASRTVSPTVHWSRPFHTETRQGVSRSSHPAADQHAAASRNQRQALDRAAPVAAGPRCELDRLTRSSVIDGWDFAGPPDRRSPCFWRQFGTNDLIHRLTISKRRCAGVRLPSVFLVLEQLGITGPGAPPPVHPHPLCRVFSNVLFDGCGRGRGQLGDPVFR